MREILFASLMIAMAAAAVPGMLKRYMHGPEPLAGANTSSAASADAPAGRPRLSAASGQVAIRAEGDGHFYVEAEVNARPVRLLVDTGATVVALRESDALAAGIQVRKADFTQPVATANGKALAADALIQRMVVEDIAVDNVRALILPDAQLSVSLLGGSFLRKLARYEVEDGTLIFEN